ncbi:MAG: 4-(cytidine 5'-diphospho)-2-C-methyl-D-erythritol kinase [Acidobacteria bacterium]|nr:4-(cytidine 5'-diphospho)-2-C-methyl-D-erythritol kinase [Acidobacteriota bacterium]
MTARSRSARAVRVRAHAKINLDLRVIETRSDGYHELRTVFQAIELHDVLTFTERRGPFTLRCQAPGIPLDDSNLIWRAASALWQALGRGGALRNVSGTIEKRIPAAGGLGGGSSNAAAALAGLAQLWRARVSRSELGDIAADLGADVPFFLYGGTALGLGRGDEIYPLQDVRPSGVLLVFPSFGVSTPEAFAWYDEDRQATPRVPRRAPSLWPIDATQLVNDLDDAVGRRHPEIAVIESWLRSAGAISTAMSGSGSAVFGLFDSPAAARAAAPVLARSGWRAVVTRTMSRDRYARRARPVLLRAR